MAATAGPNVDSVEPAQLTIRYTENQDGWITAQVVEYPAAISQGSVPRHREIRLGTAAAICEQLGLSADELRPR